ncbi:MAG: TAXI family TRAP transporter solute-binding subunit [Beijerinckiaceae bacterium]
MRHPVLALLAVVLAIIGLGALAYFVLSQPTTLRVAVGPVSNENVRIVTAAIQTLQRERENFRLRLVITDGTEKSAAALDAGNADLAIVRTDMGYPRAGATVAVLHTDHAILVAPGGTGIASVADFKGKTVAILRDSPGNLKMLGIIAAQAGLAEGDIKTDRTRMADLKAALEQGRIQGVLAVGPTSGRLLFDVVNTVTDVGRGQINFVPIPETNAIEQRYPLLEADTLVRGLFGGPSPRPERDVPTLVVSHTLMAAKTLSDATVSDFTRVLLNAKSQIAAEAPLAVRMEAPDQEKSSPIPIHPGTITYLDGQTSTFLERYGDWFYIGIMGFGLGGSALAGYLSWAAAQTRRGVMRMLSELQQLAPRAQASQSDEELTAIETTAGDIFEQTMAQAIENNVDPASMTAFNMAFAHVRNVVSEKRKQLSV